MIYKANGKLLISGEYLVLDGAKALAVPTKKGQSLKVHPGNGSLHWISKQENGKIWFEALFDCETLKIQRSNNQATAEFIVSILNTAKNLGSNISSFNYSCETSLDFPLDWGLGSSSTLICNVAAWLGVDAFDLHKGVTNGSGYDITAGIAEGPIVFQNKPELFWAQVPFAPPFKDQLYFIHLNKKASSSRSIESLGKNLHFESRDIDSISDITMKMLKCTSLSEFSSLMELHEGIVSRILGTVTVKERLFSDYSYAIKSLGAWGGDFILAVGTEDEMEYFRNKGFETIVPYEEMVLS